MSVLTAIIDILRAVSLIVWIGVGVVTLLGTWRIFQKTEVLLDTLPAQVRSGIKESIPTLPVNIPEGFLKSFPPPAPTR